MKNTLTLSSFLSLFMAFSAHSVNLQVDLVPEKTPKIKENGFFEVSEIENPYSYNEKRLSKSYDAETHSLTLENITQAYLETKADKINLKEENGNLNFEFKISTTPFTTGKSEEENHYSYTIHASVPGARVNLNETIMLKPTRVQFLGASRRVGPIDERKWIDIKLD